MTGSSIGFGWQPFGNHQFGFGDWAEEMLWKNIPQFYKDCDEDGPTGSTVSNPLRKFQNALKPSYQEIRIRWHQFPYLWDAIKVPISQLPQLAYNVGIEVDPTKSESLQRSSVLNASQLWINKGTDKGYQLTAAFEGLLVIVTPLWTISCGPSSLTLGTIGTTAGEFDLSTTLITPRPVSPGTLHIKLTTELGIEEDIRDDGTGNLVGYGNQLHGPLTRLGINSTVTLTITSIVGVFNVGDTITQGPATATVVNWAGLTLNVVVVAGSFSIGAILDTVTLATANVTAADTNVLIRSEVFDGLYSGTSAVVREFKSSYLLIDRISLFAGFTPGETLRGRTSGAFAVAGTATQLVPGPLQARLSLSSVVGTVTDKDEVVGGTSGAIGIVRTVVSISIIDVDTITLPGFSVGETITSGTFSAVVDSISFGTIDYIAGLMTGNTVHLLPGSEIQAVTDLSLTGATQFVPSFDETSADLIPTDSIQTDQYDYWPINCRPVRIVNGIVTEGESRSHSLRLFFYTPDNTEIEEFSDVANRIQLALETFRPLHVQFDKITFDGTRASSQVWRTNKIVADVSAASLWTVPATGNQLASSQTWLFGPLAASLST